MLRKFIVALSLLLFWQFMVSLMELPAYILPSPLDVIRVWLAQLPLLLQQSIPTLVEIAGGLIGGIFLGVLVALSMSLWQPLYQWLKPILLISQALPIFALAPLLVIWFGYGILAKIITTMLMIFFPIASAFHDGLQRTNHQWLDLADVMGASKWRKLWLIRVPAAQPAFVTGLRVATAMAPMGAIISEWVGASKGLGFLLLNANARLQIDLMFAALFMLIIWSLLLYTGVNYSLQRWLFWQPEK